ncbi:MAG: alpha/beta hydrolase [Paracoccaceae bacterium]
MSMIIKIAAIALIVLAVVVFLALLAFQNYGVYRFTAGPQTPEDVGLDGVEVLEFTASDGQPVRAWLARAQGDRPYLFNFYGNSAAIGESMAQFTPLIDAGYGVVTMQYRGTQGFAGQPTEMGFAADALALYDRFDQLIGETVPPEKRVLNGFSLGAGVGSRLAANRPFAGVILVSAPYRTCQYFERRYRGAPLCRLMWRERYDIVDHLRGIESPVLIVHGARDASVPVSEAEANYAAAPNPWGLRLLEEGGHANLAKHGLTDITQEFMDAVAPGNSG